MQLLDDGWEEEELDGRHAWGFSDGSLDPDAGAAGAGASFAPPRRDWSGHPDWGLPGAVVSQKTMPLPALYGSKKVSSYDAEAEGLLGLQRGQGVATTEPVVTDSQNMVDVVPKLTT